MAVSKAKSKAELDVSHLKDVVKILTYCKFNTKEWLNLGLELGLLMNTLSAIETDHKGVERCLLQCLNKWLSKADNMIGSPTWESLASALRSINEKAVAELILTIMTHPASCLLRSLDDIPIMKLIEQFVREGIILRKNVNEVERYGLLAICPVVVEDCDKLKAIGKILCQYDDTRSEGERLLKEYDETFSSDTSTTDINFTTNEKSLTKTIQGTTGNNITTAAASDTTVISSNDNNQSHDIPENITMSCSTAYDGDEVCKQREKGEEIQSKQDLVSYETSSGYSTAKKHKGEPPSLKFPQDKIRSYQNELARTGLEGKNYIICAPTGSGKTLIAAIIIHDHLNNKKRGGKVLFVVRTQQLAYQQTTKLREYLEGVEVIEISGESETLIHVSTILPQVDIVVCTAGKLANELESKRLKISETSLLIMDECHHAIGLDPYAIVMEHYLLNKSLAVPQVVGMTASPGAGRGKYPSMSKALTHQMKLCARLDATSGIKCVRENVEELTQCVPRPNHESHTLPQRKPGEPFVTVLSNAMSMLEEMLPVTSLPTFDRCSSAYQQWIKLEIEAARLSGMEQQRDQISILELLEEYYLARITYDDFEIENAQEIIKEVKIKGVTLLNDTEKKLQELHINTKEMLCKMISQPNPLLRRAEDILYHHFSEKPNSKALFFVRDIRHTDYVTDWIKSREILSKLVTPCSISGYARRKAMTKEEQVSIIESFRSGQYNLLVTTSVLEEGLDVPECNMVIRFQIMSNEVADVQAQGRARAEDSTMHTIITSDSHTHHRLLLNNDKKELAVKTVQLLSSNFDDDKFHSEIYRLQGEIIYQRTQRIQAELERKKTWNPKHVLLLCYKCGATACKADDVCKFGKKENPHYVVFSDSFVSDKMEKMERKGKPEPAAIDDFTRPFKIACKKCHEEWGIWGVWKNSGLQRPVIKCNRFTFHNTKTGQRESGKQWKKTPFEILFYTEYDEQDD